MSTWTSWPSPEALSRDGRARARQGIGRGIRLLLVAAALWGVVAKGDLNPWATVGACLGVPAVYAALWGYFRATLRHRLWPALGLMALLLLGGAIANGVDAELPAVMLWCGCGVLSLERLPLVAGLPVATVALTSFALFAGGDNWLVTALTSLGLALAPAALAQDKMGKDDGMKKDTMSKDTMKKDTMKKDDGMKKDSMKKDDTMKK